MEQVVSGQTEKTQPELGTHYPALDGLRAIAFSLVFLSHYQRLSWTPGGVNFFFVLSGFLITGILWDTRDRPSRGRTFYMRRTLRVFPLYYGVLLLVALTTPLFRWEWHRPWLAWPLYLGNMLRVWQSLSQNGIVYTAADAHLSSLRFPQLFLSLGHLWSLCIEEQFYLLWPAVVWAVRSRHKLMVITAAVVIAFPLLRLGLHEVSPFGWGANPVLYSVLQFDGLLLGALLALLWRGQHRRALLQAAVYIFPAFTLVAVIAAITVSRGHIAYFQQNRGFPEWFDWWGLALLNLYGVCLLLRALDPGSLVYRCLNLRPLRWLGKVSYGAYVFHDIPHSVYHYVAYKISDHVTLVRHHPDVTTSLIAFPCTLILAGASYATFETFFLNLKNRWAPSQGRVIGADSVLQTHQGLHRSGVS